MSNHTIREDKIAVLFGAAVFFLLVILMFLAFLAPVKDKIKINGSEYVIKSNCEYIMINDKFTHAENCKNCIKNKR